MKKSENIDGCKEVFFKDFPDPRGRYSSETQEELRELGMSDFKQLSESLSCKGVVRGLHFQKDPYCQAKVVCCTKGRVLDVVVDLRKDSPTYKQYTYVELTPENGRILYVPRGYAHGFVALEDDTTFNYMVDNKYYPRLDGGIPWNDPEINIPWD